MKCVAPNNMDVCPYIASAITIHFSKIVALLISSCIQHDIIIGQLLDLNLAQLQCEIFKTKWAQLARRNVYLCAPLFTVLSIDAEWLNNVVGCSGENPTAKQTAFPLAPSNTSNIGFWNDSNVTCHQCVGASGEQFNYCNDSHRVPGLFLIFGLKQAQGKIFF